MANDEISDLLIKFVDIEGNPIPGESQTQLPKQKKSFLRGFEEENMFEVISFTFKAGLGGEELDENAETQKKTNDNVGSTLNQHAEALKKAGIDVKSLKMSGSNGFKKFRFDSKFEDARYPVDMKPVEFERFVDTTSSYLLWHCIHRIPFKSATMIKRKAAGGPSSGEAFLRFDFNTVLIKSVSWDDGQPIKETVEFVSRAVTVSYKPQLPDGSLGYPLQAFWKSSPRSSLKAEKFSD